MIGDTPRLYPHLDKVDWYAFSENPAAVDLLRRRPEIIDWEYLSKNPAAIDILEANQDKIDWYELSSNPAAIHLLEANPEKICWHELYRNPNAGDLFEKFCDCDDIQWFRLSRNPCIFEYDYEAMLESRTLLHEELLSVIYHPENLTHFKERV
jgi:hypothetical protein